MKYLYIFILVLFYSCQNVPVGYLITDNAEFEPDTMLVKIDLDIAPPSGDSPAGKDYERYKFKIPWLSMPIQGIDGTKPLHYDIEGATKVGGGDVTELLSKSNMRGDGAIEVDLENNIPAGEYLLDIKVSNEGHAHVLPKIFRIVVK